MDKDQGAYGQNIAAGVKADNVSAVITELFYNGEVSFYISLLHRRAQCPRLQRKPHRLTAH